MQIYTGPQVIYAGTGHDLDWLPPEQGRCRVCGGQLLKPVGRMKNMGLWTDDKLIADPIGNDVCAACDWAMKNRTYIAGANALWATPDGNQKFDNFEELLEVWTTHFSTPSVFLLWDSGAAPHQKHAMLRTIDAVTYSPEYTYAVLYGLGQMGRASALIPPFSPVSWNHTVAVVAFSAPRMVANVDLLTPKAAACLDDILDQVNRQKRKKLFNIQMVNRYRVVGTLMRELIHTCGDTSLGPMAHLTLRLACERAATLAGVPLRRRE